jgi:hypothetical protein
MSIPGWLLEIFAGVALLVALLSAGYLMAARAWRRPARAGADVALSQVLMGIALAGVLVAGLSTLPNAVWAVVFAAMTAWFDWRLWQASREHGAAAAVRGPYAPQLVYGATLLYLFAALGRPSPGGSSPAGMAGMPGMSSSMPGMAGGSSSARPTLALPTLAFAFAVLVIAFTIRDLDRPAGSGGYFGGAGRRWPPAVAKGGRVALGVTLALILIIMI